MSLPAQKLGFFDLFECHAAIAARGAREVRQLLQARDRAAEGAARVHALRYQGGLVAGRCLEELHLSFATPIDREVIERLTRSLQGALDMLEEAAARVELYRLEAGLPEAERLADLLLGALGTTAQALTELRQLRHADRVMAACDRVAGLAQEAERVVRGARARLFKEELDPLVIVKWGDVLDHLAAAATRCRDAGRIVEAVTLEALS